MSPQPEEFSLTPQQILPDITAGVVTGIISVLTTISLAAMVFSGDLDPFLAVGVSLTLLSNIVIRVIVTLTSSFPGIISNPQAEQMALLAIVGAYISGNLSGVGAQPETLLATVLVAIALSSLLTGVFLLAIAPLRISEWIRYIPYPIIGGFLAGIGFLLVEGALKLLMNQDLSFWLLLSLARPDRLLFWVPSVIFAVALLLVSRQVRHVAVLPVATMGAIALFYGVLIWTHTPLDVARADGWLLGPFDQVQFWQPLTLNQLRLVEWSLVWRQGGTIAAIVLLTTLSLLLNSVGLEVLTEKDLNLKRELRAVGIANIAVALLGGVVGSHSLKSALLAHRMGGRSRLVGLSAAAVFGVVFAFGPSLLSVFPRPVLGGLLLYTGLTLLVEWAVDAYFKLPRVEYAIVLFILTVIAVAGFLPGIGAGLVVAALAFVVKYSRVNATRRIYSGTQRTSNVERSPSHAKVLVRHGEQIYILELQGFIFFGTANNLLNLVRQRLTASNARSLRFVVFDFHLVNGLDASAVLNFNKIKQLACQHQIQIVLVDMADDIEALLRQGNCIQDQDLNLLTFPDLDRGLEYCENRLLATHISQITSLPSVTAQFEDMFPGSEQVKLFRNYLQQIHVYQGDWVFRQGDPSNGIYFVAAGQVSLMLERSQGRDRRLRAFGPGAIVGEMGIYGQTPRSASLLADSPTRLYHLSAQAIAHMEQEAPALATRLHKVIIHALSERLIDAKQHTSILTLQPVTAASAGESRLQAESVQDADITEPPADLSELLSDDLAANLNDPEAIALISTLGQPETSMISSGEAAAVADVLMWGSIDQEFVEQTRRMLVPLVGPAGHSIIRETVAEYGVCSPQEWIEAIAAKVPASAPAEALRLRLSAMLHKSMATSLAGRLNQTRQAMLANLPPSHSPPSNPPRFSSPKAPATAPQPAPLPNLLNPAFIERCRRELAYCIGPMASYLLEEAMEKHPSATPEDLVEAIAAKIPDSRKAREFCKRAMDR